MIKHGLIISSGSAIIEKAYLESALESCYFLCPKASFRHFKIFRYLIARLNIPFRKLLIGMILKKYSQNDLKYIVIFDSILWEKNIDLIRHFFPKIKIYYYYWNKIDERHCPNLVKKYCDDVITFDKKQSKNFGLRHEDAFGCYGGIFNASSKQYDYDFSFIGADKGRRKNLIKLATQLNEYGYKCFIYILSKHNNRYTKDICVSNEKISYTDNLAVVTKTKCLIELSQKGQSGLTVRVMEALYNGKKLLSDNVALKTKDFYHPNNIFIFEGYAVQRDKLYEFLQKDFIKLDDSVYENYTFKGWLKRVIN